MNKFILFFFLLLISKVLFAQQILKGNISLENSENPNAVHVVLKNAENRDQILSFTQTNAEGKYQFNLSKILSNKQISNIIIEVYKVNYIKQEKELNLKDTEQHIQIDFHLTSLIQLEPIIITADKKPVRVKNDTVSYNAESYKDGTERVVEDLLRKLPGIDVDEQGRIKYKGKHIERVLLQGDDLFNYNYTIGTKNISVDIIDEVEAIENWSENPLLKKIENSKSVVLNLKLKKGISDVSLFGYGGYGIKDRVDSGLNLLSVAQKNKNFSTLSYNNLGENRSPYAIYESGFSEQDYLFYKFRSDLLIHEMMGSNQLSTERNNSNEQWFASMNHIANVSKKLALRFNLNYVDDFYRKMDRDNTDYFLDGQPIQNNFEESISQKKPQIYQGDVLAKIKFNERSLTEISTNFNASESFFSNQTLGNRSSSFNSIPESTPKLWVNELKHTYKINDTNALQFSAIYAKHESAQNNSIDIGLDIHSDEIFENGYTLQDIAQQKETFQFSSKFLSSDKNENKLEIEGIFNFNKENLHSNLLTDNSLISKNDMNLKMMEFTLSVKKAYDFKRWKLIPALHAKNFMIENEDILLNKTLDKNQFFLAPSLSLHYQLASRSKVFLNLNYNEAAPETRNLFNDWIMQSHRYFKQNQPNLAFRKTLMTTLGYTYYNLRKQEKFVVGLARYSNANNPSTQSYINENFVLNEQFNLAAKNKNYSAHVELEKYLHIFRSTIKLSGNYLFSEYNNVVNNSQLRLNQSNQWKAELGVKSAFNFPFNFSNNLKWNQINFNTSQDFTNSNSLISNNFKLIFKKDVWSANLGFDYYHNDIRSKQPIYFLDSEVKFRPNQKSWSFALIAKNLLNMKNYESTNVTDYYIHQMRQSLNPRYILLKMDFRL